MDEKTTKRTMPLRPEERRLTPKQLRELGILIEANRLFFHPLGLQLSIWEAVERGDAWQIAVHEYEDCVDGLRLPPPTTEEDAGRLRARLGAFAARLERCTAARATAPDGAFDADGVQTLDSLFGDFALVPGGDAA